MNFFKKKKVLWKKHIIFSSSFFGHCLKKFRPCYVSSGKIWGKTLNFLKNIQVFLLSGNFRYKTGTFSSSLSNLHCTCQWEHFERKLFFCLKGNILFYHFQTLCEKFQVLSLIFFGRVAEAASYMSMKTIWRKTIFKGEVILPTHFCASKNVFCAWWQKFFSSVVKKAFYVSM